MISMGVGSWSAREMKVLYTLGNYAGVSYASWLRKLFMSVATPVKSWLLHDSLQPKIGDTLRV